MTEQKQPLSSRFAGQNQNRLQKITEESNRNWKTTKPSDKSFQFFGLEQGNRFVRRFKLYFRDGQIMSIPYAHLPLFVYEPKGVLFIQTNEISITIKGRALVKLLDWFNEERIIWIKQSPSGVDTEEEDIFIESMVIQSDAPP